MAIGFKTKLKLDQTLFLLYNHIFSPTFHQTWSHIFPSCFQNSNLLSTQFVIFYFPSHFILVSEEIPDSIEVTMKKMSKATNKNQYYKKYYKGSTIIWVCGIWQVCFKKSLFWMLYCVYFCFQNQCDWGNQLWVSKELPEFSFICFFIVARSLIAYIETFIYSSIKMPVPESQQRSSQ